MAEETPVTSNEETEPNSKSILNTVKKTAAGLTADDDSFDDDIIIFINNAFFKLKQLGVFKTPYTITGATETWTDCLGENEAKLSSVPAYISLYVKMTFDPNQNGTLQNSLKEELREMEQRFIYECDPTYDDVS